MAWSFTSPSQGLLGVSQDRRAWLGSASESTISLEMEFLEGTLSGRFGMTVLQINYLLYLLFCSTGTNKSKTDKTLFNGLHTDVLQAFLFVFRFFSSPTSPSLSLPLFSKCET